MIYHAPSNRRRSSIDWGWITFLVLWFSLFCVLLAGIIRCYKYAKISENSKIEYRPLVP